MVGMTREAQGKVGGTLEEGVWPRGRGQVKEGVAGEFKDYKKYFYFQNLKKKIIKPKKHKFRKKA